MTTKMSIRELSRNSDKILDYDYVEITNNRSKESRGLFVPPRYADEVKKILERKIEKERRETLEKLRSFEGILRGKVGERSVGEIKRDADT